MHVEYAVEAEHLCPHGSLHVSDIFAYIGLLFWWFAEV